MKRIKFKEFSLNWYRIISLIFAFIFIILGSGLFMDYESIPLVVLGIAVIIFELSRRFWYSNYVKYSSKGILIRINSSRGKKFIFSDITKIRVTTEEMIVKSKGENHIINLDKIDRNDIDDLADIIKDKSNADYTSEVMHEKFH